ncbi:MAG: type II secretion system protein [Candidatus Saccharimonadales bacterium]
MGWCSTVELVFFECSYGDMKFIQERRGLRSIRGFTIIELLVVIVVLGILGLIALNTINPGETSKRSRDTTRAVDLKNINQMLVMYEVADGSNFGLLNTVYISLPDSNAACSSYVLPTLPSGWSYACKDSVNYRNTDGSGWIPVDFGTSSTKISKLPIDPVNTATGGLYYLYVTGGSWELNVAMEAESNVAGSFNDKTSIDGGDDPTRLEIGNDLALSPWRMIDIEI